MVYACELLHVCGRANCIRPRHVRAQESEGTKSDPSRLGVPPAPCGERTQRGLDLRGPTLRLAPGAGGVVASFCRIPHECVHGAVRRLGGSYV